MRKKGAWSNATYTARARVVEERGSATFEGEQRVREGKSLDPLVDPKEYGVIRGSNNLLVPKGEQFELKFGVAMPVETDIDTTGSMGENIGVAFRVQPKVQNLLIQGTQAVLRRYHTQIATGVIQDKVDRFPYQRSQFEPDNEVERQMGLLDPQKWGGDAIEDYQLGLFAAAYLTTTSINRYGLRGYYFAIGDQRGRDEFDLDVLKQVFGPNVIEKAFGAKKTSLPSIKEVAEEAMKKWHVFFLQINDNTGVGSWWKSLIGKERIIKMPRAADLAEAQATIIGLSEGVLDLQNALEFLQKAKVSPEAAVRIVEACRGIPIGLQKTFPNFDKIPAAGSIFASREDIWPIGTVVEDEDETEVVSSKKKSTSEKKDKKDKKNWKL